MLFKHIVFSKRVLFSILTILYVPWVTPSVRTLFCKALVQLHVMFAPDYRCCVDENYSVG